MKFKYFSIKNIMFVFTILIHMTNYSSSQNQPKGIRTHQLFDCVTHKKMLNLKKLLENGANPNSYHGNSSLLSFIILAENLTEDEKINFINLLLSYGADLDIIDTDFNTPLMAAVENDFYKITFLLLEKNATVNARSKFGETPLHAAIKKNYIEIAHLLLEKGADPNIFDNGNFTPFHNAIYKNSPDMINLGAVLDN